MWSPSRPSRPVAAAALTTPVAFTAVLLALGYPPARGPADDPLFVLAVLAFYVAPVACVGALAVAGWRRGLRLGPAVGPVGLLAAVVYLPPDPAYAAVVDFGPRAAAVLTALAILWTAEYAVRYPDRARDHVPPRVAAPALVVGVVHAAALLWVLTRGDVPPADLLADLPLLAWALAGLTLLGAVPAVLLLRHSLVTPALLVGYVSARNAAIDLYGAPVDSMIGFYVVVWPVFVALALGLAAAEYVARDRAGLVPPRSLVT